MIYLYVSVLIIFMFLSMVFSSSDMAFSVVDQYKLKKEISLKNKYSARMALYQAEKYDETISTILFCNNLVNIGISSFATTLTLYIWPDVDWAVEVALIVVTVFLLLFGEIIPKIVAKIYAEPLSKIYALPIQIFRIVFFPIVWLTTKFANLLIKPLIKKTKREDDDLEQEELQEMVDTIEEEGIIDSEQGELLRSAITFTETQAFEIMTPRVDMYAFDVEDNITDLLNDTDAMKHSRIPVYEETTDNIIGVLMVKELLKMILEQKTFDIKKVMLPPLFIPRSIIISDLLAQFKTSNNHIAIVKDEYGGTDGIVTIEDIVEELVGDIFDEYDQIEEDVVEKEDGVRIIDGSLNIDDFFEMYDYEEEDETDYSTVGGWCVQKLDHFAKVGDSFETDLFIVKILKVDETVVEEIEVTQKVKSE